MQISIIIPTLNEADNIGRLIHYLKNNADATLFEIIVVDADSHDDTEGVARCAGATTVLKSLRGRAVQMNLGAQAAKGDVLYFIHADCTPPASYCADIQQFIKEGYPLGCYRSRFDKEGIMLKINAYFTRFSPLWCRGGDETLYVTRAVFDDLNGYDTYYSIMEEYDFIKRAREKFSFKIIPKDVVVSARKYETNSWLRVMWANFMVFRMFKKGVEPEVLGKTYKTMLIYR